MFFGLAENNMGPFVIPVKHLKAKREPGSEKISVPATVD
jgi:hypothetical protein